MGDAAARSRAGTTTEGMMMYDALIAEANARLYSGVVSDVLDGLGNMHLAIAPGIRPLDDTLVLFCRSRRVAGFLATLTATSRFPEIFASKRSSARWRRSWRKILSAPSLPPANLSPRPSPVTGSFETI